MSQTWRSFFIIIALVVVVALAFWAAFAARTPPKVEKRAEPTVSARAVQLQRQTRRPALFLIGRVEARDYATLNAPIEADILQIAAREGRYFDKGARLVRIDLREVELTAAAQAARLDELRAQLTSTERNRIADQSRLEESARLLQLAKGDHARNKELFDKKALTLRQLEQSEQTLLSRQSGHTAMANQVADYGTQRRRLEAQLAAAEADLEQTRLLLRRAEVRAPFAGRVARVHAAVGARPARGAPLLDIFDPSRLRLRVAIAQRYADAIKDGDIRAIAQEGGARLTLAYAGLEPQVEAGASSVDAFFDLPKGDWVLGAVRDVTVELPPLAGVAAAPPDAIYNDSFVYRVGGDSRAEAVQCRRLGLARATAATDTAAAAASADDAERLSVLLDCPQLQDGDSIVADQLPNLLSGVLLKIIDARG